MREESGSPRRTSWRKRIDGPVVQSKLQEGHRFTGRQSRRSMLFLPALVAAASSLGILLFPLGSAQALAACSVQCGEAGPLVYHESGKGVLHAPKVYLIFWGSNFKLEGPGKETKQMLETLAKGLSNTAYQGILTQYFDSTGRVSPNVSVRPPYLDKAESAPTLSLVSIEKEVEKAIEVNHWPKNERDADFMIASAPGAQNPVPLPCGIHGVTKNGEAYSFVRYAGDYFGLCAEGKNPVRKTSVDASHEYAETVTDPYPRETATQTWNTAGNEIGDLCGGEEDVELSDGAWVQPLYDDHLNKCAYEDLKPPDVYAITGSAELTSTTTATLSGTVNPEQQVTSEEPETGETTYFFEYRTASGEWKQTPAERAQGRTNQTVTQTVPSLLPKTTYQYRLAASNKTGLNDGAVKTFRTSAPIVTEVRPDTGPEAGGTTVTITGANFTEKTAVLFGGEEALEVNVESSTVITAKSPPGQGTVDVTVTTPEGTSAIRSGDRFAYGSGILHNTLYPSANAFPDEWTPYPALEGLEAAWERTKQEGKREGGEAPALTHYVFTSEAKEEAVKVGGYKLAEGEKVLSATMHIYAKVGYGDELYVHLFHGGSSEPNRTITGTTPDPGEAKWYALPTVTGPETQEELENMKMKAYLLMRGNYSDIYAWYVELETQLP